MSNHIVSPTANNTSNTGTRLFYLDWLRIIAILAVFVYHCAMIFATDAYHIKNSTTYEFIDDLSEFIGLWGMPLIWLISGASVFHALGKVSPGKYFTGIVVRLLVPLVIGTFTHIALGVYLERLHAGEFSGSFFDFYPHYFDGMYGFGGNFAWMGLHLWYLEALFIFSLLCLPIFLWLKNGSWGRHWLQSLGDLLAKPGAAYLLALPAIVLLIVLDPDSLAGNTRFGGWSLFIYLCFFISGFVMASSARLQASILRQRWLSVAGGIVLTPVTLGLWLALGEPHFGTLGRGIVMVPYSVGPWCWLLAIFGFGLKHLNVNNPFLKYANEAVLPFYILHQTVILALGHFVVGWAIPDLLKFSIILSGSFASVLGVYEFGVRRNNLLRVLFGMKPKPRHGLSVQPSLAPQAM